MGAEKGIRSRPKTSLFGALRPGSQTAAQRIARSPDGVTYLERSAEGAASIASTSEVLLLEVMALRATLHSCSALAPKRSAGT